MSLKGRRASPLQMWMESQLLHGACGLEDLTADDPHHVTPFAAIPTAWAARFLLEIVSVDSGN